VLSHAHPAALEAVRTTIVDGLSFGAPTELEVRYAGAVIEAVPSIKLLPCVSSGTVATMSAVRVARGYTKRDVV